MAIIEEGGGNSWPHEGSWRERLAIRIGVMRLSSCGSFCWKTAPTRNCGVGPGQAEQAGEHDWKSIVAQSKALKK